MKSFVVVASFVFNSVITVSEWDWFCAELFDDLEVSRSRVISLFKV